MRKPFKWSILLAALLFGLTLMGGTGVGAQDETEADFEFSDLEGLQHGVARGYTMDFSAMYDDMMSTPDAEFTMPPGLLGVNAMVLEFDGGDNSEKAMEMLSGQLEDETMTEEGVEEYDIDLGDQSRSFYGVEEYEGTQTELAMTIVRDDKYIYVVTGTGSEIDVKDTVKQFTEVLIDNDGSGEGEYAEDGTSTGGLWDKFPASDDDLISGLVVMDMIIFPESEEAES